MGLHKSGHVTRVGYRVDAWKPSLRRRISDYLGKIKDAIVYSLESTSHRGAENLLDSKKLEQVRRNSEYT